MSLIPCGDDRQEDDSLVENLDIGVVPSFIVRREVLGGYNLPLLLRFAEAIFSQLFAMAPFVVHVFRQPLSEEYEKSKYS